ncbi:serine O-acetyltransferase activity [Schizosaccharomyces octosporus yFS286]|uniref:Serine O-acetyltransferase activity n=1 Tax=Schizosaccharomyces octosporus (strain yFS286) TaxID=483514 RepID=S9RN22_SCHOY|nr:serine O-acetyltransferase activity [Schizosaccharomyces octosporus yFS286]EPX75374.1 serine O-acetyltransferase activity [Schizosaccharomyces octosporus yFS286]
MSNTEKAIQTKRSFKTKEYQKMVQGELYYAPDPELQVAREFAKVVARQYNDTLGNPNKLSNGELKKVRAAILSQVMSLEDNGSSIDIEPPIGLDYGLHIRIGKNFYANNACNFLDVAPITIGDNVLFGPSVQLCTATHPLDISTRNSGNELAKPIKIGNNVWIGLGAIILPGVTLGDGCVIGAGSVVTKDIPANTVAVGSPARVVKEIDQQQQ